MPTSSKAKTVVKKTGASKKVQQAKQSKLRTRISNQKKKLTAYMNRRPHRSFRLSRRRDYVRPLSLPGNIAFTHEVTKTVWQYKKHFLWLTIIFLVLYGLLVGMQSQETYASLSDTLKEVGAEAIDGNIDALTQASLLLLSIGVAGVGTEATESQQIFSVLIFLLIWLTTVWLLRNLLAGHRVKLRDGLYNAGAPIFAMVLIVLVIALQLIPFAIALIGYNAAETSGLIAGGGAGAMLFWIGALLLTILSLYWITSSLFAMIIVTIPGMYPYQAIKTAGDMVLGRRIKILLRWLWMGFVVVLAWGLVMIPVILLDMGLKSLWPAIAGLPIVPLFLLVTAAGTTVWVSAYVYLLYRKVVDNVTAA